MKTKNKGLSPKAIDLYNSLLDLNWSEPFITIDHIQSATGIGRHRLTPVLDELISSSKVLAGNEEALGVTLETFTPIIKGGNAYGYPLDFFKDYNEWSLNKL